MTSRFPSDPTVVAFDLMAQGAPDAARRRLERILRRDPAQPDALHGLACLARASGEAARAVGLAGKALAGAAALPASRQSRIHITLGLALLEEGHVEPARAALHVAVLLQPSDPRAHGALAEAHLRLGQPQAACDALRQAADLAADDIAYIVRLAEVAFGLRRWPEAADAFRRVTARYPENGAAWANIGAALFEMNDHETAREALQKAIRLGCGTVETRNNLGLVQMALGDLTAARDTLEQARLLAPDDSRIGANLGTVLADLGRDEEARYVFRHVVASVPDTLQAQRSRFNLGTLALGQGRFAEGWEGFEARLALPGAASPTLPVWDGTAGEDPVLVTVEQGLGDTVQFLRFLPQAAARCPLVVQDPICRDFVQLMRGLDRARIVSGPARAEISLLSLPYVLGMSDAPDTSPYLHAGISVEPDLVGLCWAGNSGYRFDSRRSVPPACLEPFSRVDGVRFLSLQRGETPSWMENPGPLDCATDLADAVGRCALVVSVDTLVAHVAGAVGRPLWLMNRFGGDWRWKGAPWYQDVRQFAPVTPDLPSRTWPDVIGAVCQALRRRR